MLKNTQTHAQELASALIEFSMPNQMLQELCHKTFVTSGSKGPKPCIQRHDSTCVSLVLTLDLSRRVTKENWAKNSIVILSEHEFVICALWFLSVIKITMTEHETRYLASEQDRGKERQKILLILSNCPASCNHVAATCHAHITLVRCNFPLVRC
jgi:hypothetical protein